MQQKLVILGGGESGVGAACLGKAKGYAVFLSDLGSIKEKYQNVLINNEIEWEEKQHSEDRILSADLVVKSPGIPDTAPLIKRLKEKNIEVISEIEFASKFTQSKMVGITGSNGKTTTTLWTHHILNKAGLNVAMAGNVGKSLAMQVIDDNIDTYIVELSSFQLDGMFNFKADIAVLLNITPDHLDRYEYDMQKYIDSKFRITQNQTKNDYFIYNLDDEIIVEELKKRDLKAQLIPFSITKKITGNGAYIENEKLIINLNKKQQTMSIYELALQGKHNIYNSMASGLTSRILELRKEVVRESLTDFKTVEHRLEPVVKVHGINFINDSKATNLNSAWYALESVHGGKVVWIVGGVDKGNDYQSIMELVENKVKAIVCLGKDNTQIIESFKHLDIPIIETQDMDTAVSASYRFGKKGDTVLLSPACASFDLYEDYQERGRSFKESVRGL